MSTLFVAIGSFVAFIIAYNTYGRWLARKVFALDADAVTPSHELNDGIDFVPTKTEVIFGHHFTSIAGTGPIVGPAIAVFWDGYRHSFGFWLAASSLVPSTTSLVGGVTPQSRANCG